MKKLSHEQRVELAKSRVAKTQGREKRRLSLRQKKIASLVGTSVVAVGATAGISAAIVLEAGKDRTIAYPETPGRLTWRDFQKRDDAKANIREEMSGNQRIFKASKGPVNFVSNHALLYNKDKITDWLNWFYDDVSWGPEISTLASISFLSGIQEEAGVITLGYHTTSRDSSTIVLSPDIETYNSRMPHTAQSIAWALLHQDAAKVSAIKTIFPKLPGVSDATAADYDYEILGSNKYPLTATKKFDFKQFIAGIMERLSAYTSISDDDIVETAIDEANPTKADGTPNTVVAFKLPREVILESITEGLPNNDRIRYWDLYKAIGKYWNANKVDINHQPILNTDGSHQKLMSLHHKINALKLLGLDISTELKILLGNGVAYNEAKIDAFFNGFINTDIFKGYVSQNLFNPLRAFDKTTAEAEYANFIRSQDVHHTIDGVQYNNLMTILEIAQSTTRSSNSNEFYHLSVFQNILRYSNNEKDIKETFKALLSRQNLAQWQTEDQRVASALSIIHFYLRNTWLGSGLPKKNLLGDEILLSFYKDLRNMGSEGMLTKFTPEFIYNKLNVIRSASANFGSYTVAELKQLASASNNVNEAMMGLTKHLDKKYHAGKVVDGHRHPGFPIYKPGDTFYDSIVRRAAQEVMYTISHEYGHHTTLFHAQDISSYRGHSSIVQSSDATLETGGSTPVISPALQGIIPMSEVITSPSLSSYGSAYKYAMFRDAFLGGDTNVADRRYFQRILDASSDGDSRTDISMQVYRDRFNIDFVTQVPSGATSQHVSSEDFEDSSNGIEGMWGAKKEAAPVYVGPNETGFGMNDLFGELGDVVARQIRNQHDLSDHLSDYYKPKNQIIDAADQLIKELPNVINIVEQISPGTQVATPDMLAAVIDMFVYDRRFFIQDQNKIVNVIVTDVSVDPHTETHEDRHANGPIQQLGVRGNRDTMVDQGEMTQAQADLLEDFVTQVYGIKIEGQYTDYFGDQHWWTEYTHMAADGGTNPTLIKGIMDRRDAWVQSKGQLAYAQIIDLIYKLGASELFNTFGIITGIYQQQLLKCYLRHLESLKAAGTTDANLPDFQTYLKSDVIPYLEYKNGSWTRSSLATTAAHATLYKVDSYNSYMKAITKKAESLATSYGLAQANGETVSSTLLFDAGKRTKILFDSLFSRDAVNPTTSTENWYMEDKADAKKEYLNIEYGETIADKFFAWHLFYQKLYFAANQAKTSTRFKEIMKDDNVSFEYKSRNYKIHLNADMMTKLDDLFIKSTQTLEGETTTFYGGSIFEMKDEEKSVEAVVYVFTEPKDSLDYKTVFSTVAPGANPPASYIRYSVQYVETLTRAWNQMAFSNYPELMPSYEGDYLRGDRLKMASFGIELYLNHDSTNQNGDHTLNQHLTERGKAVLEMYKKFYNIDKEVSAIVRNYQTGLYSFTGWNDNKDQYDSLVFTDHQGHVIGQSQLHYDIDNFHFYDQFSRPDTEEKLTTRHSWMTSFAPLGNWNNALLKPGDYEMKFWKDANGDHQIQKAELTKITNEQVTNGGQMNSNGKSDLTAEVIGSPDKQGIPDAGSNFVFRVTDILL